MEQLCEALGEAPPDLQPDNAHRQLLALLERAAEYLGSEAPRRRLVLVVDGLDEDRSTGPSIAGLLPAQPIPGLRWWCPATAAAAADRRPSRPPAAPLPGAQAVPVGAS